MKNVIAALFVLLMLAGCSTNPHREYEVLPVADEAEQVTVVYHYTDPVQANMDAGLAQSLAVQACQAKGYADAEISAEAKQSCDRYTGYYECLYKKVAQPFRCLK